jgi:8-oxo-dGTP pyrophosphatase MutT (NUDIX family)
MSAPVDVIPQPSATVALLRDAEPGLEVLLLRRNSGLLFHGGAWVFPGGRIDPQDYRGAPADDLTAARFAAVREAREEAGLEMAPSELVPISEWTTPPGSPRRYRTWFFAAAAADTPIEVDGGEINAYRWLRPGEALSARKAGEIELPPPTFVTTTLLLPFASAGAALSALAEREFERFLPRLHRVPGGACSLYEEDAGYADGVVDREGPRHRLWMLESGWRYERSP